MKRTGHVLRFLLQVFLTKHYRNRRYGDPEFMLDFEEIYVIDSKTRSISRAKVMVGTFHSTLYSFYALSNTNCYEKKYILESLDLE